MSVELQAEASHLTARDLADGVPSPRNPVLFGGGDQLSAHLARALDHAGCTVRLDLEREPPGELSDPPETIQPIDTAVYLAAARSDSHAVSPDLLDAEAIFDLVSESRLDHLVVISSSAVHEPSAHHPQRLDEGRLAPRRTGASFADSWQTLERMARELNREPAATPVTLLRPTPVVTPGANDFWSLFFRRPFALRLPGYDPTLQLLAASDLAASLVAALAQPPPLGRTHTYHVAPAASLPLKKALRHSRALALAVPRSIQRPARMLLSPLGVAPAEQLEALRYPSTVDDDAIRRELGFAPRHTSAEALDLLRERSPTTTSGDVDPFGLDIPYIRRLGATLFRFLHDFWWRIESRGLGNIPATGAAVLAGVHRGFQPWDGVMAMHSVAQSRGRFMRFLVHPTLLKPPFLAPYMQKLGGVPACRQNGDWVLRQKELLAIFPEGIRGAFKVYGPDIYELGSFGRHEFVRLALRHGAPIVPFVTVGSAEIFPIWKRFEWSWWRRAVEWPYFPITPTMGTVPLPSKWHTRFLEPIPVDDYPPSAAEDPRIVRRLSDQVRQRMRDALDEMLERRRHVFFGSLFREADP